MTQKRRWEEIDLFLALNFLNMLEEMSAKMMWLSYVAELTHKLKKSG